MALRLDIKKKLDAVSTRVKAVDIHTDEPWVLAALYNGNVLIWDYKTQTKLKSFEVCDTLPIRAAKFIPRMQWIVVGCDDYTIRVYNYNTMEKVKQIEGAHKDYIRSIDVHPTLPYFITSSDDMQMKLWDWSKGFATERVFEGHLHFVMMVKFNPKDPQRFASASLDSTIKFWGLTGSSPHFSLEGHEKGVNCIDFYPGGDKPYIISGSDDMTVRIWDYQTKACVQTLSGHTKNISAVSYHPRLPVIITASEDHSVRLWHNTTYRLSSTLNYGKDRAWCIAVSSIGQKVVIGYDQGTVVLKVGHENPVVSMDPSGKCIWTVNNDVFTASVKGAAAESGDGEVVRVAAKDMGSCEVFPQSLSHNSKGTFFAVCGNGEYIIYTTIRLRNKTYGSALDFVWNAEGTGNYAIRESNTRIKTFKDFTEAESFKPPFSAEGLFGGPIIGVRSNDFVVFYDWEKCNLIRRIDVCPRNIFWNDDQNLVVFACATEYYVLRYNADAVTAAFSSGAPPAEGVATAFELIHKVSEKVRSGQWVGDCFVYTSGSKLNYFVGGEVITHCHLDAAKYLLGFLPKENKVFLMDKSKNIISYTLLESILQYQTAVVRKDFETANALLPSIPKSQYAAVSRFLESQGYKKEALAVTDDPDQKFDLALQLNNLELACEVMRTELSTGTDEDNYENQQKWKKLGDLAMERTNFKLAEECLRRAVDLSGLLLLYSATGNSVGMNLVGQLASQQGKTNIAFIALFSQGKVSECIDLLCAAKRIPEAAFLARTYLPSRTAEIAVLWKEQLLKVSARAAAALASPAEFADRFVDLEYALKVEQLNKKTAGARIPAQEFPAHENSNMRDLIEAVKQLESSGKLAALLADTGAPAASTAAPVSPPRAAPVAATPAPTPAKPAAASSPPPAAVTAAKPAAASPPTASAAPVKAVAPAPAKAAPAPAEAVGKKDDLDDLDLDLDVDISGADAGGDDFDIDM